MTRMCDCDWHSHEYYWKIERGRHKWLINLIRWLIKLNAKPEPSIELKVIDSPDADFIRKLGDKVSRSMMTDLERSCEEVEWFKAIESRLPQPQEHQRQSQS